MDHGLVPSPAPSPTPTSAKSGSSGRPATLSVGLVCDRTQTELVKAELKQADLFDRVERSVDSQSSVIVRSTELATAKVALLDLPRRLDPADIDANLDVSPSFRACLDRLPSLSLDTNPVSPSSHPTPLPKPALALSTLQRALLSTLPSVPTELLHSLPSKWELYESFLLFPRQSPLQRPPFTSLNPEDRLDLLSHLAKGMQVTHVASKGAISGSDPVRRPGIVPLFGDFSAFWTSTIFVTPKGRVTYVWKPDETMYSKGNAGEKLRIAGLDTVWDETVVDLYCGIGYFVFPYILAGARRVIACDISPFAIEGLRRGALANSIPFTTLPTLPSSTSTTLTLPTDPPDAKLFIYPGENSTAMPYFRSLATHVNLGLLPSPRPALPLALSALDPKKTTWLHFHEEVKAVGSPSNRKAMEGEWAEGVRSTVERLEQEGGGGGRRVDIEGVCFVKQIAPMIHHVVVQLRLSPPPLPTSPSSPSSSSS